MSDEEIKDIASLKELRENAEQFATLREAWPVLRPIAKLLGVDTGDIEEKLEEALRLERQVDEMAALPDRFNSSFADRGWVMFELMEPGAATRAIEIADEEGFEKAEDFLVEYFSPDWVEARINWLKHLKGFRERFDMARRALEDYKAGRFYASVLVTLSLIDGWVNELNIVGFQREGFFSQRSRLVAWDSIAAHPKGLVRLQEVYGKVRKMTRTEEIRIPYRHGIIHGMDLGYNNKYVAAKSWAALFAVREWAIKAAREGLSPPELEPEAEETLWESIESYLEIREEAEWLKRWQPREVVVGESVPAAGRPEDYAASTPERKIVEFLNYWLKENYGYMAKCYAPIVRPRPVEVRDRFEHKQLLEFKLLDVDEVTPAVADVKAELRLRMNDEVSGSVYQFRLAASDEEGELVHIGSEDTVWGITTWRLAQ
jgi:hypothetical protein